MTLIFTSREKLGDYEWDFKSKKWQRPELDAKVLKELNQRSNSFSFFRLALYVFLLVTSASLTVAAFQISVLLALPLLYFYYFIYGFLTAIGHEIRHKTMLTRELDKIQEGIFFVIQTLMWQSPVYERVSHKFHHRYTMVRDQDPETDWPEVISRKWIAVFMLKMLSRVLIVGGIVYLVLDIYKQLVRGFGAGDKMMQKFCTEDEKKQIHRESLTILGIHSFIILVAIVFHWWYVLVFITIAWQIGQVSASMYFYTEHLSKVYNTNEQRLCTRSVKVGPFVKLLYWGLDDHVEHHLFPGVPSCNLPKLHDLMKEAQDERVSLFKCWMEIIAIASEKEKRPINEYIPAFIRNQL